jgi:paraquat-inducible protein B
MAEDLTLDDVGYAEQVIHRLLQERKMLENAEKVLQTYRLVKAAIEPASQELADLRVRIESAQQALDNVNAQKLAALDRAEKEVTAYSDKRGREVEDYLASMRGLMVTAKAEYDEVMRQIALSKEAYQTDIAAQNEMLIKGREELEGIKREHAVLAEAVGRAASIFR